MATMLSNGGAVTASAFNGTAEEPMERKIVSPPNVPSATAPNTIIDRIPSLCDLSTAAEGTSDSDVSITTTDPPVSRGGVVTPFPWKLHDMLENADEGGYEHIVSWQPHGRCFAVHKQKEFVDLMSNFFNQTKFASFQRQLNLYGFHRLTTGRDKGSYYHPAFLRGKRNLVQNLTRQKVKGTKVRRAMAPALEPQFYSMPFMPTKNGETPKMHIPSSSSTTTTSHRLYRTISLENCTEEAANDICFFEGKQFHFFDKSMVLPPSKCDASSLKRENTVIQTWMTVIDD